MPDAIVIGAGPNGLVAANMLADEGWDVLVLEAQPEPGGAVRSGELLPGHVYDRFSAFYPLAVASPPMAALDLERYGLRWRRAPLVLAHPFLDREAALLSTDPLETAASVESFAAGDGAAWLEMLESWRTVSQAILDALLGVTFPPVRPLARLVSKVGPRGAARFARFAILPVRRMAEEEFGGAGATMLLAGNALHSDLSPDDALSGVFGWILAMVGQEAGFPVPEGGAGNLTAALVRRLEAAGGRVVCGTAVRRIDVRDARARGVVTADGERIEARRAVLADVGAPALYLDLVGREHLPSDVIRDLARFQYDDSTVKIDWVLDGPAPWTDPSVARAGTVHLASDLDHLTEAAAQLSMGVIPDRPFLVLGQSTVADPTRAPDGAHVMWAYTHVPQHARADARGELKGVWDAHEVEAFVARMEDEIERYAPGFRERIVTRQVSAPADLEAQDANLVNGAVNGGTSALHQQVLFRPIPGTGRPATVIRGLYLASASAHPGGGVHGACGANAARSALARERLPKKIVSLAGAAGAMMAVKAWRDR